MSSRRSHNSSAWKSLSAYSVWGCLVLLPQPPSLRTLASPCMVPARHRCQHPSAARVLSRCLGPPSISRDLNPPKPASASFVSPGSVIFWGRFGGPHGLCQLPDAGRLYGPVYPRTTQDNLQLNFHRKAFHRLSGNMPTFHTTLLYLPASSGGLGFP